MFIFASYFYMKILKRSRLFSNTNILECLYLRVISIPKLAAKRTSFKKVIFVKPIRQVPLIMSSKNQSISQSTFYKDFYSNANKLIQMSGQNSTSFFYYLLLTFTYMSIVSKFIALHLEGEGQ